MKRLLASSKFWALNIGVAVGSTLYYFLGDGQGLESSFVSVVIGAYSTLVIATGAEDVVQKYNINKK